MNNPYSTTPPPPLPYAPQTNSLAVLSLISGILGWLGIFGVGGILAVVFGHMAKKEIHSRPGVFTGEGMATAGLVLGYINIAVSLLGACLFVLFFTGAMAAPVCLIPFMNDINTGFTTIP